MSLCHESNCNEPVYNNQDKCKHHYMIEWRKNIKIIEDPEATRVCKVCKVEKPLHSNFHKSNNHQGGYIWRCKACEYTRRKAKRDVLGRAFYAPQLLARYGLTLNDYDSLNANQDGKCAICRGVSEAGKALAVDHDHTTGVVRALLCTKCNQVLGLMQDNPELLRTAAVYVESFKE